jgi:hypothetical protein
MPARCRDPLRQAASVAPIRWVLEHGKLHQTGTGRSKGFSDNNA